MKNCTIENMYLKLCNEFRTVIRFMTAAIYRRDYQKLFMCPFIKRLGRAFKTLGQAFEDLRES